MKDSAAELKTFGQTNGPLDIPHAKELVKFEASLEEVPGGVTLKEYERVVKLNKATNPPGLVPPDANPYIEKRKLDGGAFRYKPLDTHLSRRMLTYMPRSN